MRLPPKLLPGFIALACASALACGGADDSSTSSTSPSSDDSAVTSPNNAPATGGGSNNGNNNSASDVGIDACALVTASDAESALGSPVKAGESSKGSNKSDCQYLASSPSVPDNVYIQLGYSRADKDAFELAKTIYSDPRPLQGIGDDAFYLELGAPVVQVHVLKDGKYLVIAVLDISPDNAVADATALAKTAASRL